MAKARHSNGSASADPQIPVDSVHPADRAEWRDWLSANHGASPGVWLITWRKGSGRPVLAYEHAVEEALCFGWVDSLARALDDHRTMLRFTRARRAAPGLAPTRTELPGSSGPD